MKVTAKLSTELYAGCPNCGLDRAFCLHEQILKEGHFGPLSCGECHHVYNGERVGEEWQLTLKGVNQPTLVLLELPPQKKPVYFVVDAAIYALHSDPLGSEKRESRNRFHYEENSCSTAHVGCETILNEGVNRTDGMYIGDDIGLFKYVGEIDRGLVEDENPESGEIMKAFSHLVPELKEAAEYLGFLDD